MKTSDTHMRLAFSWLLMLMGFSCWAPSLAAEEVNIQDRGASLQVGCAPDKPVVHPGESVTLKAWVTDLSGNAVEQALDYNWSASAGQVSGDSVATWSIGADSISSPNTKATAKLAVRNQSGEEATCELMVYVAKPAEQLTEDDLSSSLKGERSGGLNRRRAFLLSGESAPAGYGLYSYLLFSSRPKSEDERQRYLKAIESYLLILEPLEEMEHHSRRSQTNIMLLPLTREVQLPENLSDPKQATEAAKLVLAAYDYRTAQDLLTEFDQEDVSSGPLLFATLSANPGKSSLRLRFDMSHVEPKLIWDWVKEFLMLTTQESSWNKIALTKLCLSARNFLAVAAKETPEVVSSLKYWANVLQ